MTAAPKFRIRNITFPRINSLFISAPTSNEVNQLCRVEALIQDARTLRLLFGVQVVSGELIDGKPKVRAVVEAIGEFEFEDDIPEIGSLAQFPLIGNMLALLYPFIREKIHYCLSNNQMTNFFLPPINTIELIKGNANNPNFRLSDGRKGQQELTASQSDD